MRKPIVTAAWALLLAGLLAGLAAAVPSPNLTEKARQAYLEAAPSDADYDFLFEEGAAP